MNVCLVSSARALGEFDSTVADRLAGLGLRVVVVFLHPQGRHLWNQGTVVYFSPSSAADGLFGEPVEAMVKRGLERSRHVWLRPLQRRGGFGARVALGVERRAFRIAVRGSGIVAGRLEAALGRLMNQGRSVDPFAKLPQGAGAYGVFHALDAGAVEAARAACAQGGAIYAGPETGDLQKFYEDAIMRWLRA